MRAAYAVQVRSVIGAVTLLLLAACDGGRSEPAQQPTDLAANVPEPAPVETAIAAEPKPTKESERNRLREKAKTDPEGADAEAIDNMGRNELLATAINSAGYLCARVTDMYPRGGDIIAHCVEYRSGSGRVKYRVNPSAGTVEPM